MCPRRRYHSLVVEPSSLPPCLQPIAWATGTHQAVVTKAAGQAMQAQHQEAAMAAVAGAAAQPAKKLKQLQQQEQQPGGMGPGHANGEAPVTANGAPAPAAAASQPGGDAQPLAAAAATQPLIMGLAHTSRPHFGVQFHPESICTRFGMRLLLNFHELSCSHLGVQPSVPK